MPGPIGVLGAAGRAVEAAFPLGMVPALLSVSLFKGKAWRHCEPSARSQSSAFPEGTAENLRTLMY